MRATYGGVAQRRSLARYLHYTRGMTGECGLAAGRLRRNAGEQMQLARAGARFADDG